MKKKIKNKKHSSRDNNATEGWLTGSKDSLSEFLYTSTIVYMKWDKVYKTFFYTRLETDLL